MTSFLFTAAREIRRAFRSNTNPARHRASLTSCREDRCSKIRARHLVFRVTQLSRHRHEKIGSLLVRNYRWSTVATTFRLHDTDKGENDLCLWLAGNGSLPRFRSRRAKSATLKVAPTPRPHNRVICGNWRKKFPYPVSSCCSLDHTLAIIPR